MGTGESSPHLFIWVCGQLESVLHGRTPKT